MIKDIDRDKLFTLFIESRAAFVSDKINHPDLGEDDEWLFLLIDKYLNNLTNLEFLQVVRDIVNRSIQMYSDLEDLGFILNTVVSELISRRPTKKYLTKYPNNFEIPLDLIKNEEDELFKIIYEIRDKLPPAHKYRADSLVEKVTGEYPTYKYGCKRCIYKSNDSFVTCPACGKDMRGLMRRIVSK
ncbi:MAG: hypothetical protein ABIJ23_03175 [Candidatus Magasanikbacteria bacterium]